MDRGEHPLDRPIWYALNTRQKTLAMTSGSVVRMDPAYGPFAAACDSSGAAQAALKATLLGPDDRIGIVEREPWPPPPGTRITGGGELVQMIADGRITGGRDDPEIALLKDIDAPDMAALARATEPGPWADATHRFGDFYGVRIDGRLAAMAGERMKVPGLAEVSGVCVWPEFRGRGLAAALIRRVMRGMVERGDVPFLHSYAANDRAVRLYEGLGFRVRARMEFTVLALA